MVLNKLKEDKMSLSESKRRIYQFLKSNYVGVLSSVDPNGYPDASVIYYSIDDTFNARFITKRDTKKNDNLSRDGRVVLVVFDPSSQTTTQVRGVAETVVDSEAQNIFDEMLKAAYKTSESHLPPISKLYAGPYIAYKIKPTQIRMAIFSRPDPGGYDIFETIDF